MFDKLLSALPYNPSLVHQLSFYAKRMKAEKSVRRIGLVFIALSFFIQFFAFISPPQPTLAASPNDLVNGGFSSAAEAAADCNSNLQGYGTILANYGITCAKVASASTITITSTEWNKQLYSMGRLPASIAGETSVAISGTTYYARYLWGWDSPGTTSTYQALNVTSTGGQTFLLLYPCGNLTSVGFPVPVQQAPELNISKTTTPGYPVAGSTVTPGTALYFRVNFGNQGGAATNVHIIDPDPANATPIWQGSGAATSYSIDSSHTANWLYSTLPSGATGYYVDVEEKVNPGVPNGTQICNVAYINSDQTPQIESNKVCMTVETPATPTPGTPAPTPPPVVLTPVPSTPPATCPYDSSILLSSSACVACTTNPTIIASDSQCKSCEEALSSEDDTACVIPHKAAANLTQNIVDANNSTAQAGDVIKYTLTADNTGKSAVNNYVFQDNLSYVLDYACLASNGTCVSGNTDGSGTLDSNNDLVWAPQNIDPGQTISEQFEVKVDNPIPQTPTSTSDPNYFNLVMSNTYGNTISINLPASPAKVLETTTSSLPNTGPGESIFFGAVFVAVAGFFFYRSRILVKESTIVVKESIAGGI